MNLFGDMISGKKTFDVRLADFKVEVGDTIVLEEWDERMKQHTGRAIEKEVKYVYKFNLDAFGQKKQIEEKGLYVLGLE